MAFDTARDDSPLPRVRRKRVADEIVESLIHDVASGRLERGQRLMSERDLAARFEVSQPTLREAIRVVDAMGLVEVRHGSGVFATGDTSRLVELALQTLLQIEQVGILEVLEVRGVLGRYTAVRAVTHATEADVSNIRDAAIHSEKVDEADRIDQIAGAVVGFQLAVSMAAHSQLLYALEAFLIKLIMQFQLKAMELRGVEFFRTWTVSLAADRRHLVESLARRDEHQTREAMDRYLEAQRQLFGSDPELASVRLSDPSSLRTVNDVTLEIPI